MAKAPLPKTTDEDAFDDLSVDFAADAFGAELAQRYGRRGSSQHGVDSLLKRKDGSWVGAQAKCYEDKTPLPTKLLDEDLKKAHAITPPLEHYAVVTTKDRNTTLSDWARNATINGKDNVRIYFWDDIEAWLRKDANRLGEYVQKNVEISIPAMAHALIRGLGSVASPSDIISYIANGKGGSAAAEAAKAHLRSGRPDLAVDAIRAELDARIPDIEIWRIGVASAVQAGDVVAARSRLDAAEELKLDDLRLDALRATVLLESDDVDAAGEFLKSKLPSATGEDGAKLWNVWLQYRSRTERPSYDVLREDVPDDMLAFDDIHIGLGNAAAIQNRPDKLQEHLAALEASANIGRWVVPLLRGICLVAGVTGPSDDQRRILVQGARQQLQEAITHLRRAEDELENAPRSPNRLSSLVWRGRAHQLLGELAAADEVYEAILEVARGRPALLELVGSYAAAEGRPELLARVSDADSQGAIPRLTLFKIGRALERGDADGWNELCAFHAQARSGPDRELAVGQMVIWATDEQLDSVLPKAREVLFDDVCPEPVLLALVVRFSANGLGDHQALVGSWLETRRLDNIEPKAVSGCLDSLFGTDQELLIQRFGRALDGIVDRKAIADEDIVLVAANAAIHRLALQRAHELLYGRLANSRSALVVRLRASLQYALGYPSRAFDELTNQLRAKEASPRDLRNWAWFALLSGKLPEARRLLTGDWLPPLTSSNDVGAVAAALLAVGRTNRYQELVEAESDKRPPDQQMMTAAMMPAMLGKSLKRPSYVAPNTVVSLVDVDTGVTRSIWITNRVDASSSAIERVRIDDPSIASLLGQVVGNVVAIERDDLANQKFKIESIASGYAGEIDRQIAWASAQGIQKGGVDVVALGNTEELVNRLRSDRHAPDSKAPKPPLAMLAHLRNELPLATAERLGAKECYDGNLHATRLDEKIIENSRLPLLIDPVTILVAENYGFLDLILRAAEKVACVPQTYITLAEWWWHEKNHRRAAGSLGLANEEPVFQEHDSAYRARGREFWRSIRKKLVTRLSPWPHRLSDDEGEFFGSLSDAFDRGTLVTLASGRLGRGTLVTIDAPLIPVCRALRCGAANVLTLLAVAAGKRRIPWREVARVKAMLARNGWGFISTSEQEMLSVITANDDGRDDDLRMLTKDFERSSPISVAQLITSLRDRIGSSSAAIDGETVVDFLVSKAPKLSDREYDALLRQRSDTDAVAIFERIRRGMSGL
jgi:hypothetical protein